MSDLKSTKNKHMTLDDRQEIQECLDKGMYFKAIARRIGKDPTTVSKEVKKHLTVGPLSVSRSKADGTPLDDRPCPLLLKAPFVLLGKEEFWKSDAIIASGIKKGQHLYHIMKSNDVAFSKSSAYRHLHKGYYLDTNKY